jgi:hypothetical protein
MSKSDREFVDETMTSLADAAERITTTVRNDLGNETGTKVAHVRDFVLSEFQRLQAEIEDARQALQQRLSK